MVVLPALIITALTLGTITELIFKSMIEKRKEELKERNRTYRKEAKVISISTENNLVKAKHFYV